MESARTYLISDGSDLSHQVLHEYFRGRGWKQVYIYDNPRFADFIWATGGKHGTYDKRIVPIRAGVKSMLNESKMLVCDKEKLYMNISNKSLMARTWEIGDSGIPSITPGAPLIARPVGKGAFGGRDIRILTSARDLEEYRRMLGQKYGRVILSEYVTDPLLWRGRKFHLRCYCLVVPGNGGQFKCKIWDVAKILTAAKPFVADNYNDPGIHDTHVGSTPENLLFPEDFLPDKDEKAEQRNTIIAGIYAYFRAIEAEFARILAGKVGPYPESRKAFEVFGLDILVRRDGKCVLLECNDRVGYSSVTRAQFRQMDDYKYVDFSAKYFTWLIKEAIASLV